MATPRKATLLDLVQTVGSYATSDAEIVATVALSHQQRQGPAVQQLRWGEDRPICSGSDCSAIRNPTQAAWLPRYWPLNELLSETTMAVTPESEVLEVPRSASAQHPVPRRGKRTKGRGNYISRLVLSSCTALIIGLFA